MKIIEFSHRREESMRLYRRGLKGPWELQITAHLMVFLQDGEVRELDLQCAYMLEPECPTEHQLAYLFDTFRANVASERWWGPMEEMWRKNGYAPSTLLAHATANPLHTPTTSGGSNPIAT
jgi:hypothetical protein